MHCRSLTTCSGSICGNPQVVASCTATLFAYGIRQQPHKKIDWLAATICLVEGRGSSSDEGMMMTMMMMLALLGAGSKDDAHMRRTRLSNMRAARLVHIGDCFDAVHSGSACN